MKKIIPLLSCAAILSLAPIGNVMAKKNTGYTETRYPIVLVHGMLGFDKTLGIDYWYGVAAALRKDGARVHVAKLTALDSNEARGEQLIEQLEYWQALYNEKGFNLIAHSQGGPTSRYAMYHLNYDRKQPLIKSLTTIGSPHKGSPVADVMLSKPVGDTAHKVFTSVMNGLAGLIEKFSSNPQQHIQNFTRSLSASSTPTMRQFNQYYPAGVPNSSCGEGQYTADGVRFYSWSGTQVTTNVLDPTDWGLSLLAKAFKEKNDGLVSRCSSHFGQVIRDNYQMNHVDQINHLFGLHHLLETDPITLFRQHANRLKHKGL
ncbi:triacylglycerol lipase [Endozoicomonas sp. SM1973]|uniref:Triacylglycerol lipase n=1 Tax=Spartinivicinus marinus TaxID=2994442 RepID=A0A853I4H1_9GAMM|nr:triacylglycerol lipase [Spartinivicinus marinus]MCX4029597.1 triacylglycerol lipase [Spartinivicinus marinus]NYZ68810.1 triacylglycerol lipase [Spartinivicinus marinus]